MDVLLAIDPSIRETGWAVFAKDAPPKPGNPNPDETQRTSPGSYPEPGGQAQPGWSILETGAISIPSRSQAVDVAGRILVVEAELDKLAEVWRPQELACVKQALVHFPQRKLGIEMLNEALARWAGERRMPLFSYHLREIRAAISGRANCGKEELAYSVMTRWGLLGEGKTTHEWTAIAVGDYHQVQKEVAGLRSGTDG